MANFFRYVVQLGGWTGSPGYSILHSTVGINSINPEGDIGNFINQIRNGYDGIKAFLAPGVTMNIASEVTEHNTESGLLIRPYVVNPPPQVVSTAAGATGVLSRATMTVCRHNTDLVTERGSRITGRTFVKPLANTALAADGTLNSAAISAFTGMWGGMQNVAKILRLVVWHRPADAYTKPNGDTVPASPGSQGHSQNTVCLSKPGILRSRRD